MLTISVEKFILMILGILYVIKRYLKGNCRVEISFVYRQ